MLLSNNILPLILSKPKVNVLIFVYCFECDDQLFPEVGLLLRVRLELFDKLGIFFLDLFKKPATGRLF